jgi:hypothetical protein
MKTRLDSMRQAWQASVALIPHNKSQWMLQAMRAASQISCWHSHRLCAIGEAAHINHKTTPRLNAAPFQQRVHGRRGVNTVGVGVTVGNGDRNRACVPWTSEEALLSTISNMLICKSEDRSYPCLRRAASRGCVCTWVRYKSKCGATWTGGPAFEHGGGVANRTPHRDVWETQ